MLRILGQVVALSIVLSNLLVRSQAGGFLMGFPSRLMSMTPHSMHTQASTREKLQGALIRHNHLTNGQLRSQSVSQ